MTYCLIVAACNVMEENINEAPLGIVSFHAVNGDIQDTKTSLQPDGSILWSAKDKIDIFVGAQSFEFTGTNDAAASEITFTGSLDGVEWTPEKEFWAVYPHSANNSSDGASVTVSLPAEQEACVDSFAKDLFISMAKSQDYNLTFFNVCGGIKFSVTEAGVKSVTFKGNNGEAIAGSAKIAFDQDDKPFVQEISNPLSEVTLLAPNGTTLEVGKWYYIVCFPAVLENGYSMTLNKADGTVAEKKGDSSVAIKRAIWGRLTEMDSNLAYNIPNNEIWYYTKDGEPTTNILPSNTGFGAKVISNTYENNHGVIKFDGPINVLPEWAFGYPSDWDGTSCNYYELNDVTKIVIPSSVKSIQANAIVELKSLETLCLPEGLESIDSYSIAYCDKLDNIVIPASVKSIGNILYECPSLMHLSVAPGNAKYDSRNNCNAIIETSSNALLRGCAGTVIPNSVNVLMASSFQRTGISSISIPNNVTEIGDYAFEYCKYLTSVKIPDSVIKVGRGTFMECPSLKEIQLPKTKPEIGDSAFMNCGIEALIIPEGWTSINKYMFYGNQSLKSVSFPNSVTSISDFAFTKCSSLETLELPSNIEAIGYGSFEGCVGLKQIRIWAETPPSIAGSFQYTGSCPIYVPAGSVELYKQATPWKTYSSRIQAIAQPNNEIWYKTRDGKSTTIDNYSEFGATLVSNIYSGGLGIATFDADVTKISSGAFDNENITEIYLPASLKTIGFWAFSNSSIESIIIPESVEKISIGAFRGCYNLRKFEGKYASNDGKMLITIDDNGKRTLVSYADPDITTLNLAGKELQIDYIGSYALSPCKNLKTLYCDFEYCDYDAFADCNAENVTVSYRCTSSISTMGNSDHSFPEMRNLTILGDENYYYHWVNSLGWYSKLETLTLPENFSVMDDFGPGATVLPYGCKIYGPNASADNVCWIVDGTLNLFAFPTNTDYYRLPESVKSINANIRLFGEKWNDVSYLWSYSDWDGYLSMSGNLGVIIPESVTQISSPFCFQIPSYFESYTPPTITSSYWNSQSHQRAFIYVQQYYLDTYRNAWADFFQEPDETSFDPDKVYLLSYYNLPNTY